MRTVFPEKLEAGRVRHSAFGSDATFGGNGAFFIQGPCGAKLTIVASDGGDFPGNPGPGWEHVSVSTERRCPNWQEMAFVKDLFWDAEECVIQYHPPASTYVNNHQFVLHLWRHRTEVIPMPPEIFVGVKKMGTIR